MVSVFEEYSERINSHVNNVRGRYELDTRDFILSNFDDSPTYREIEVNEDEKSIGSFGVRVNMIERMGNIRNLILKPGDDLNIGNMTSFEGRTWLIFDKFGYPGSGVKVTAMRTNYNLKWIDRDGVLNAKRCYASSSDIGSKSKQSRANIEYNKYDVKLPFGQLYVFIETTDATRRIDLNQRFIINNIVYEVIGVDNTTHVEEVESYREGTNDEELNKFRKYGIIQYTFRRITKHPRDDFELGIAYNNYLEKDIDDYIPEIEGKDNNISSPSVDKEKDILEEGIKLKDENGIRKRGGSIW